MVRQKLGLLIKKLTGNSWSFMLTARWFSASWQQFRSYQVSGINRVTSNFGLYPDILLASTFIAASTERGGICGWFMKELDIPLRPEVLTSRHIYSNCSPLPREGGLEHGSHIYSSWKYCAVHCASQAFSSFIKNCLQRWICLTILALCYSYFLTYNPGCGCCS